MPSLRFALTLLTLIVAPTAARVSCALANPLCGQNSVFCFHSAGTITSTDSLKSCSDLYSNASYDLIRGSFAMRFQNFTVAANSQGSASVAAVDQYRVEGLSPGTPLVFSADLDVSLDVYGYECPPPGYLTATSASATLKEGDSNQSSVSVTTPVTCLTWGCCAQAKSLRTVLKVIVTRSAGEPFTLHFGLATSGHGSGYGSGQLHFSALPPGAYVVSCQGYRQDFPTAAKRMSWGGIKMFYR
jgi:hypothetical protein